MKAPDTTVLTYESFTPVGRALDFFYDLTNRAADRKDARTIQFVREKVYEWGQSINNSRLNYDNDQITPIVRLNLTRAYNEVRTLLKVIELKLASVKR